MDCGGLGKDEWFAIDLPGSAEVLLVSAKRDWGLRGDLWGSAKRGGDLQKRTANRLS